MHQRLKQKGPVRVPREFVFMDRAAIGLGGVFIHLGAELNFYRLFNEALERFDIAAVEARQEAEPGQSGRARLKEEIRPSPPTKPFRRIDMRQLLRFQ